MAPLLQLLFANGLTLLGDAVLAKGKEVIEEKLGFDLSKLTSTPEGLQELRRMEMQHEQWLMQIALEGEKVAQTNVSERWRFDMTSDSWLSKNIRPLTLAYWTVAITILILLDSVFDAVTVKQAWIDLIETSYMIVLAAYFVGRTVQHVQKMRGQK